MKTNGIAKLANQIIALRSSPQQGGVISAPTKPFSPDEHLLGEYVEIRPEGLPRPLIYKSGTHTGAMIALFLPTSMGRQFAQLGPGALPPNELHITLAYLGKVADLSDRQILETRDLMRLISENHPPLTGHINGCGRFCNGDDDGDPFFVIPDLAVLPNLREIVISGLKSGDIEAANDHGFVPHITLTYLPHAEYNPFDIIEKTPISFPAISLVLGDDRYDYPLTQVGAPLSYKAFIEKIGARHTGAECTLIQKMHDLTLDLGAECHPLTRRAGARHSHADQGLVQRMHDDCAGLGAECKAPPEKDRVYGSQVLKEGEIIKGSAGSGNFGHDGRPGRLGGSQGGGGLRRIGAKKDSKPGARKKAAKKFRDKRKDKKTTEVKSKDVKLDKFERSALQGLAKSRGGKGFAFGPPTNIAETQSGFKASTSQREQAKRFKQLKDKKLLTETKITDTNSRFNITDLGKEVLKQGEGSKPSAPAKKKPRAPKKDLTKMSKGELNAGFLNAKNHKERTSFAEELLKDFSDNTVAKSKKDIPKASKGRIQPGPKEIADKGKNTIFKLSGGAMGLGKVLQGAGGEFWNGNFGQIEEVTPVFKADLTTKAQSDAPNYQPASTPQRCANCRFFLGDPGRDWCELFDFTADPDYVSDAWEPQRPNEIPGYVANKGDLAALTEGILILRGSAGSGNFGHTGRPGKLGGSAGGGGLKRIGAKKKSSPAARKKAAKKFRTKRATKPKAQAQPTGTKKPATKAQAKPKPKGDSDEVSRGDAKKFGWLSKEMESFEKDNAGAKIESGAVYSKDGKELFRVKGEESAVDFNESQLRQMKGAVVTHNHPPVTGHPDGGSFSPSDIQLMFNTGAAEVRAVTENYIHVVKPKMVGGRPIKTALGLLDNRKKKIQAKLSKDVRAGKLKRNDFAVEFWHQVWKTAADDGLLSYERVER